VVDGADYTAWADHYGLPERTWFEGDFTDEEISVIEGVMENHVPARVYASFNNWRICKYASGLYTARRATWTMDSITASTAWDLARKISDYYTR